MNYQLLCAGPYISRSDPIAFTYDAFGNAVLETGVALVDEFGYTGRERHDRSGLYYYRNRFYSPQLGRFISQDPIGMLGGTNLYAYVGNDPVNWVDPLGLYSFGDFWEDWSATADIRSNVSFWDAYSESAFNDSNVMRATAKATFGDIMGGLLDVSGLLDIQEDAEILGNRCTTSGEKILAAGDMAFIAISWYGLGTTQMTGRVAGQARTSRIVGLRNRYGQHFYTDKHGFYFAIDSTYHRLHLFGKSLLYKGL